MPTTSMKFSQFVDALLVRLYELDRANGGGYFDLNAVARDLKEEFPPGWVFDAAKVMETRGFANCIFPYGGVRAELTGEGRLYVEEGRGSTREIENEPQRFFHLTVNGDHNQVVVGQKQSGVSQVSTVHQERAPAFAVVDQIERTIESDPALCESRRDEARTLAHLLTIQLEKEEPDRSFLAMLLDGLGRVSSVVGLVANLAKLLNG